MQEGIFLETGLSTPELNLFFVPSFMTYASSSELGAKYQTQTTFSWYCISKDDVMHIVLQLIFGDSLQTFPKAFIEETTVCSLSPRETLLTEDITA